MKQKEFSDAAREYNKLYRALFGCIPSIRDYSCTQEEFLAALQKAVSEKREIGNFLTAYGSPLQNDSEA